MEALDRAGLVYEVRAAQGAVNGVGDGATTVVFTGISTDRARLDALARALAPGHRMVIPEPLRFLYLSRAHVGQRWWVVGIDGEVEPATFGDGLYAAEQLVLGAREAWGVAPLLVGHEQGGALALALARLMPEGLAGVVAVDAVLPEVPGWVLPEAGARGGLPVLLLAGEQAPGALERTSRELAGVGARVTERSAGAAAVGLARELDADVAAWWRAEAVLHARGPSHGAAARALASCRGVGAANVFSRTATAVSALSAKRPSTPRR
jgi:pimeloyl-ACP methyl ester carboxylesterase